VFEKVVDKVHFLLRRCQRNVLCAEPFPDMLGRLAVIGEPLLALVVLEMLCILLAAVVYVWLALAL
jgi:hypothetical protein